MQTSNLNTINKITKYQAHLLAPISIDVHRGLRRRQINTPRYRENRPKRVRGVPKQASQQASHRGEDTCKKRGWVRGTRGKKTLSLEQALKFRHFKFSCSPLSRHAELPTAVRTSLLFGFYHRQHDHLSSSSQLSTQNELY